MIVHIVFIEIEIDMIVTKDILEGFEKNVRTSFINSLAGFRQVALVGTKSETGQTNLAIFNSLMHLGANPALFGLLNRPDVVDRHSLQNILHTGVYTLNFVDASFAAMAHQTSARYPTEVSEFAAVGFNESYRRGIEAPFVEEAVVKIGMQFEQKVDISINNTVLIIGSIQYVELPDSCMGVDGFVDVSQSNVLVSCGLDAYFKTEKVARFEYAKADKITTEK
ncbi:flavin reductase [uncultured Cytophaga sp.]|uniref:flavin reductase family protein n=1 Tax=uncultured Cytophaga sp. TaxID=160238 RepID=UPI00260F0FEB|nr:flavin reductase [uncultured Cytophaga sp.]